MAIPSSQVCASFPAPGALHEYQVSWEKCKIHNQLCSIVMENVKDSVLCSR